MKSVKNVAELRKMALASGATARVGGQVVNATGERVALRRVEPTPAPPPQTTTQPPAAPTQTSPIDVGPIAEAVRDNGRAMEALVASAMKLTPADPATSAFAGWRVDVDYDSEGRITSIAARPLDEA